MGSGRRRSPARINDTKLGESTTAAIAAQGYADVKIFDVMENSFRPRARRSTRTGNRVQPASLHPRQHERDRLRARHLHGCRLRYRWVHDHLRRDHPGGAVAAPVGSVRVGPAVANRGVRPPKPRATAWRRSPTSPGAPTRWSTRTPGRTCKRGRGSTPVPRGRRTLRVLGARRPRRRGRRVGPTPACHRVQPPHREVLQHRSRMVRRYGSAVVAHRVRRVRRLGASPRGARRLASATRSCVGYEVRGGQEVLRR